MCHGICARKVTAYREEFSLDQSTKALVAVLHVTVTSHLHVYLLILVDGREGGGSK